SRADRHGPSRGACPDAVDRHASERAEDDAVADLDRIDRHASLRHAAVALAGAQAELESVPRAADDDLLLVVDVLVRVGGEHRAGHVARTDRPALARARVAWRA